MLTGEGISLVVGENNAGKSALLAALEQALGRGMPAFDFDDFYTTVSSMDVSTLPIIHIDIEIRPDPNKTFSTNFSTEFADDIIFDSLQQPLLVYRTQARYEQTEESIVTEFFTLRTDGTTRPLGRNRRFTLRGYLPFYLVNAFRDTIRDIQSRRGFWGRIVNSISIDATTASSIQQSIEAINQAILQAAPRITEIENRLREIGSTIPTAAPPDDIAVTPMTVDPARILRNLDVVLRTDVAPRGFPLARHGEGTRSVAHLAIFRAFIDLLAREENENLEARPVLGIEEPEVHLHPHAIRALGQMLAIPPRQMFLTTHSPDLAVSVELTSIQLLKRRNDGTELRFVPRSHGSTPLFNPREQVRLDRALRSGAIEVLFSRAVVLCEGASEVQAYPHFATALGIDMNKLSISLVPVDGSDFFCLTRIMAIDALEIPWIVSADGDNLEKLARQLVRLGKVTDNEWHQAEAAGALQISVLEPNDFYTLPNGHNLEEELIRGGAAHEYQSAISNHIGPTALADFLRHGSSALATIEDQLVAFMKADSRSGGRQWKVLFAGIVAEQLTLGGTDVTRIPPTIASALQWASRYADGTATKAF